MMKESIQELRIRLSSNKEVQELIQLRAYEIYLRRNSRPGNSDHDWLQAENEIIAALIQEEARLAAERSQESSSAGEPAASERGNKKEAAVKRTRVAKPKAAVSKKSEPKKPATKKASAKKSEKSKKHNKG